MTLQSILGNFSLFLLPVPTKFSFPGSITPLTVCISVWMRDTEGERLKRTAISSHSENAASKSNYSKIDSAESSY